MSYTPFLISNYATGFTNRLQPWLLQEDAQEDLLDGFVYRGVLSKREGYDYLADGLRNGLPYRESRIISTVISVAMVGAINGVNTTYTLAANAQIARGSFTATGTVPAQSLTDDGQGGFTGSITSTIDYVTGAVTVVFATAPTAGTVTATYSFMPGNPVMMVANFITNSNVKELIVADTRFVNRYNTVSNILVDIPHPTPYTGDKYDFFTWVNYADALNNPRLLFSNNKDAIQSYDGSVIIDYVYTMMTSAAIPAPVVTLTCSYMVQMKDRLILLRTTENGVVFPQRIRISGTGANSDNFLISSTGAGFIDIPDGSWIQGASFNRDDLIIFTEQSTWKMSYTGNDTVPFVLDKIDESRGSEATFGVITYLNRTSAVSPRGLIISDGYRVERQDLEIPDFSFNQIDQENFRLCFAGSVDADRDHYLIYPPPGQNTSQRILTTNYDEDNYAIYRLPLSCMGKYIEAFNTLWTDLVAPAFPDWNALSDEFGNWSAFAYSKGVPFSVGGGHFGEIWRLTVIESEDNPVRVRNITKISTFELEITTDWNNYSLQEDDTSMGADIISFSGVLGMQEINEKQYAITQIISHNVFRVKTPENNTNFGDYISGGIAVRVIPFSATFKKFNPFAGADKKVRCGWLYMYVDATDTELKRNISISNVTQTNPAIVTTSVVHNLHTGDQISIFGVIGMTELNTLNPFVTVINPMTFSLNGVDATGFSAYVSGGFACVKELAKIVIEVIVNDNQTQTQLNNPNLSPYQGACTDLYFERGVKKWYKIYINQVGRFIQFRIKNQQAGAIINIHALMPGFAPIGRLL